MQASSVYSKSNTSLSFILVKDSKNNAGLDVW